MPDSLRLEVYWLKPTGAAAVVFSFHSWACISDAPLLFGLYSRGEQSLFLRALPLARSSLESTSYGGAVEERLCPFRFFFARANSIEHLRSPPASRHQTSKPWAHHPSNKLRVLGYPGARQATLATCSFRFCLGLGAAFSLFLSSFTLSSTPPSILRPSPPNSRLALRSTHGLTCRGTCQPGERSPPPVSARWPAAAFRSVFVICKQGKKQML